MANVANEIFLVGMDVEEVLFYAEVVVKLFSAFWTRVFGLEVARAVSGQRAFAVVTFWT